MEELNREMQERVWQRVQSREPVELAQPDNLKALLLATQENSEAYRYLARQMQGKERERLLALHRDAQSCTACIKGICTLRREQAAVPRMQPRQEPASRMLEKCYHRERRLCAEWEQRVSDPEHGPVFGELARQSRGRCVSVIQLLGKLEP